MKKTAPRPPEHLSATSKRVWRQIAAGFQMDGPSYEILQLTLEAADRVAQAREQIQKDGVQVKDRFGALRAHPLLAVERDSAGVATRGWRLLRFEPPQAERTDDE